MHICLIVLIILSSITWSYVMVDVIHFNDGISDAGFSVFVPNHSFDSSVHLMTNIDKCIVCTLSWHIQVFRHVLDH